MKKLINISVVILILINGIALGQSATSSAKEDRNSETQTLKQYSTNLSASIESNLYKLSSSNYQAASGVEITTAFTSKSQVTAAITFGANKNLTNEREQELNDTNLMASSKLFDITKDIAYTSGLIKITLPTSATSRDITALKGALTLSSSTKVDLSFIKAKYAEFKYTVAATLFVHQFTTDNDNNPNTQKRLTHVFSLGYSPRERTSINYDFGVTDNWSYSNSAKGTRFSSTLSIQQSVGKRMELVFGISNTGNVYKANGIDNNFTIYDNTTATVFGEVAMQI